MAQIRQFTGRMRKLEDSFHALQLHTKKERFAPLFLLPATLKEDDLPPFFLALEEERQGLNQGLNNAHAQECAAIDEGMALHRAACRVLGHPIPFIRKDGNNDTGTSKTQDTGYFNLACAICGEVVNHFPPSPTNSARHYCPACDQFQPVEPTPYLLATP